MSVSYSTMPRAFLGALAMSNDHGVPRVFRIDLAIGAPDQFFIRPDGAEGCAFEGRRFPHG